MPPPPKCFMVPPGGLPPPKGPREFNRTESKMLLSEAIASGHVWPVVMKKSEVGDRDAADLGAVGHYDPPSAFFFSLTEISRDHVLVYSNEDLLEKWSCASFKEAAKDLEKEWSCAKKAAAGLNKMADRPNKKQLARLHMHQDQLICPFFRKACKTCGACCKLVAFRGGKSGVHQNRACSRCWCCRYCSLECQMLD